MSFDRKAFSFINRIILKEKSAKKNTNITEAFEPLEELMIESNQKKKQIQKNVIKKGYLPTKDEIKSFLKISINNSIQG